MSPNQYRKHLEKKGFRDVRIVQEAYETVLQETEKILLKNGLPGWDDRASLWDNDIFYGVQSSVDECQRVMANREVFVFDGNQACALATIGEEALETLITPRNDYSEFCMYRPGNALQIYAGESQNYDRVSKIAAKVFYRQVKTTLGGCLNE